MCKGPRQIIVWLIKSVLKEKGHRAVIMQFLGKPYHTDSALFSQNENGAFQFD